MATTDRRPARTGLSRRNYEQQQPSPFHRAYLESHATDRFDASQIPSPAGEFRARRRRNLSQSGTLRGAFETVSRYPTMSENVTGDHYALGTPNRRKQSFAHTSPESNPPNELAETYRQIDDAGSLVDQDEEDFRFSANRFRDNRSTRSSSGSRTRGNSLFSTADADFLNEVSDESLRRKLADHIKDEQRLKRATANRSPVLSKAGTPAALTSENLQRRDEEEQDVFQEDEEEDHLRPSLNVPANWGSRGTHRRDWLRNITRRTESESGRTEEGRKEASPHKFNTDMRTHIGFEDRVSEGSRNALAEPPSNRYNRIPPSDAHAKLFSGQKDENLGEGSPIPNTPIMVYKNSTFSKRSPTKRDSHDLLRKLSRTESPPQNQAEFNTPENSKLPERRIYDKTPVVTGAWIDTPLTERMKELPKPRLNNLKPLTSGNNGLAASSGLGVPTIIEEPSSSGSQQDNVNEKERKEQDQPKAWEKERESVANAKPMDTSQKEGEEKGKKTENQAGKQKDKKRPPLIKPDLPKSALETVMQDFKADKDSLDVGDDTLESLQQILDEKPSDLKTEAEDDAEYEKSILQKLELESSGSSDGVDLDRLNKKLESLTENINKVKKGLNGLEDQVFRDAATLAAIPASPTGQLPSSHTCDNCKTCKAHHNGFTSAIYLPRLWRYDPSSRRIRPTLLGWCSGLLLLWYFSESTMCDYYCHPFVAEACEGNCLLPDAPRFPFVIPTMLWRWLHLSAIWTPLWAVMVAFFRLTTQLLGISDGYVDDTPHRALNLSGEIRIRGTRVEGFPAFATSKYDFSAPKKQQQVPTQKPTPIAVPELDLGSDVRQEGKANLDDDSMDDDEFI
ncbi:hypothetical protein ABOM_009151 [Aspergillus bombycis]|uniref:Uncharacterized protein n=1 Tax=Aspergillus bombycis TaxID=109264 RepID=A0A1F7ZSW9_9EURO|nr:hypothetical protein ABOM_009151 [Aspergillus bombycis]OGM42165.1 hypothetical protein ABOM_009151 [Aspergillus bombycis]